MFSAKLEAVLNQLRLEDLGHSLIFSRTSGSIPRHTVAQLTEPSISFFP